MLLSNILGFFRRRKRRQLTTGSKDTNRFERILLSIGNEPIWLRSTIAESCASAPSLAELATSNNHRPTPQTNGSAHATNNGDPVRKYLSPTNSEYTDRSSVQLLNSDNFSQVSKE